jgi:tRNA/rRNA methyltransferase
VGYNHLLPAEDQRDRIGVVLVSPRNPLNIGAVARAMANFGFRRLSVAAAYAPHWREARSAVGAPELLAEASETETLAEAVAGCTLVVGTGTLTYRKPEQRVVRLPELGPLVRRELERGGRVGVVFGPEKHGLTREDLSYCHLLVEIPTDARQPSMNLGQAVAVCLYELATRALPGESGGSADGLDAENEPSSAEIPEEHDSGAKARDDIAAVTARLKSSPDTVGERNQFSPQPVKPVPFNEESAFAYSVSVKSNPAAASGELELLAGVVEETMIAAGYSPSSMREANRHDLRLLLRRLRPSRRDSRRILGLFRRILWRLKRVAKRD